MPTVDTDEALDGADVVVHHGGAGSVVAGIRAGVPAVAVPTWTEQQLNALALEKRGAGITVPVSLAGLEPLELSAELVTLGHRHVRDLEARLAPAIERAMESSFSIATSAWRDELLGIPAAHEAALVIEGLLSTVRGVSRAQ
jgi:hypothetical protein